MQTALLSRRGVVAAALLAIVVSAPAVAQTPLELKLIAPAAPGGGWDGAARAVLVVADTVKPTSAEAVASLKALGLRPVLLTGDNEATARAVAAEVGIDEVIAELSLIHI